MAHQSPSSTPPEALVAACLEEGVESRFGVGVGRLEWLQGEDLWSLTDLNVIPELASKIAEVPVSPCFALMLAFEKPLSVIPVKGFSFVNSGVLSWAFCDSSKPARSGLSDHWVLHSTAEYAEGIIAQTGLRKPSNTTLTKVAQELFQEFQGTGLDISQPFFKKAHRWNISSSNLINVKSTFFLHSFQEP
ncbi:hypothetical protein RJ639_036445 [Escallonia herrerae]|uniref:Uncharacterized protein n=1 Tax=Escallonia herrerae TaxID=1293975 RepID=A0AA88WS84_9ASTE|nr:hypothetical protein RJ639_036445 [Escallonia herrerae]